MSRQWKVGTGGAYALDLGAVFKVASMLGMEMTPGLLGQLEALEEEQLAMWAEEREQDGR